MTARPWLRHPARQIGPPPACPTGQTRYTSRHHAAGALIHGLGNTGHDIEKCGICAGWHHRPIERSPT